jgi:organic radical activating enzyme
MEFSKKTFCSAPWFSVRNHTDGKFMVCCNIDHDKTQYSGRTDYSLNSDLLTTWLNSDYVQYLRQQLTAGNPLPECSSCWKKEEYNQVSLRQVINNTVTNNNNNLDKSWVASFIKHKQDYRNDLLVTADVRCSNLCNFACAMCNPGSSSKIYTIWKKNQQHTLVKAKLSEDPDYLTRIRSEFKKNNNYQHLRQILEQQPKQIKLLGGEPLLDQTLIDELLAADHSKSTNIDLVFITNGSQDLVETHKKLSHFKSVSFVVSLEGIDQLQDYVRRGSNWATIDANISRYVDCYGTSNIYIHHTLQALTISKLVDLLEWSSQRDISISLEVLVEPDYLSLSAVPTEIIEQAVVDILKTSIKLAVSPHVTESHINIDSLIKLIQSCKFDQTLHEKLKIFLNWYDAKQEWKTILPEWKMIKIDQANP